MVKLNVSSSGNASSQSNHPSSWKKHFGIRQEETSCHESSGDLVFVRPAQLAYRGCLHTKLEPVCSESTVFEEEIFR